MGVRNRWVILVLGVLIVAVSLSAQQAKPPYSTVEYNDYTAALNEQDPQARLRLLGDFLEKYPESALRPFVFQIYLQSYQQRSNWPKVIEFADKLLTLDPALVEKVYKRPGQTAEQVKQQVALLTYQTLSLRARAFLSFEDKSPQADAAAEKAARLAQDGLQRLERIGRPQNLTPEKFAEVKKQEAAVFHTVLGNVAFRKKDYDTAAREYKVVVQQDPSNAFYTYRLGISYLQTTQPQYLPGFWTVARAVALFPDNQRKSVRDFLVSKLRTYQGYADLCPVRHAEKQADILIVRAKNSLTPPSTWALLNAEHVMAVRNDLTPKRIFDELKAGGEQQQLIWLASCGMELPDVPGKVLEVTNSDDNLVTLRLAVGQEAADANIANVEVKVTEPPEAKNLKPGDIVRVTAVLTDYQSEPFLLQLTEGQVNPEDIPKGRRSAPRRRSRSSR
ncbi:MAG: tetratricopeptide repeat protein [Terriglobia bacterium]